MNSMLPYVVNASQRGGNSPVQRGTCVVRREELFTLEELKKASGRLKPNRAPGIDWVPNEIIKDAIAA